MIRWESLDPERLERGIQLLLKRLHPGLVSLDGAGGDGGRDAQLTTTDGLTVFEIKSFGRLDASRRRQVQRSLAKAHASTPTMTRWVLVIPMRMTPIRPGGKSSEQAWFTETLPRHAPGVELDWWGQDWLDDQLVGDVDVQRYIEGADSQLLQRASELSLERAVLANGAVDLTQRLEVLRNRIDEVSPFWTLDFSVVSGSITSTLRGKTPDAHEVDPITIRSTFAFDREDATERVLRDKLVDVLDFGGDIELPAGVVTGFDVDASPEARRLFPADDPRESEFAVASTREALDQPIRCVFQVIDESGVVSDFSVYLRERTSGRRGVTVIGGDAMSIITITLGLPYPKQPDQEAQPVVVDDARFHLSLPDTLVGLDVTSLRPVIRTLAAATPGRRIRISLPELGLVEGPPFDAHQFAWAPDNMQVVEDLHRMEQLTGRVLRYPAGITRKDASALRSAVRQLDGEEVEQPGTLTLTVRGEAVGDFLNALDQTPRDQLPGGFLHTTDSMELTVGDLTLNYGAAAFWAPSPRLLNRPDLDAARISGSTADIEAKFEATEHPFRWLPRSLAEEHLSGAVHS
ncbi:hypothetical protein SAMN04488570_2455 [Nocardioides scoriae]|uniref:Uncharacterized protein n=1 Tax=Nocardioides scoriae TaxID=642780 RepID=A0A1H1U9A8_9ACTN|nr:hypothetical protein [Nocardioides scoriae]SDS69082.1 hypothetical protein SAMN04488570_2455 [Nocardioides scoriae]